MLNYVEKHYAVERLRSSSEKSFLIACPCVGVTLVAIIISLHLSGIYISFVLSYLRQKIQTQALHINPKEQYLNQLGLIS